MIVSNDSDGFCLAYYTLVKFRVMVRSRIQRLTFWDSIVKLAFNGKKRTGEKESVYEAGEPGNGKDAGAKEREAKEGQC
jgi:hypothetical protein